MDSVLAEVDALDARESCWSPRTWPATAVTRGGERLIVSSGEVDEQVDRVRLLYLYPSDLTDELIGTVCATGSRTRPVAPARQPSAAASHAPLGDGERFLRRIGDIPEREPEAAFRSNFIVGYPARPRTDHDQLIRFVDRAELDWCGFFAYSEEDGTYSADLDGKVDPSLVDDRLAELRERQDRITAERRDALVGREVGTRGRPASAARTARHPRSTAWWRCRPPARRGSQS